MRMGGSFGEKPSIVNKDEPRINTNRHEYGWTSLINEPFAKFGSGTFIGIGHKRHKITACDFCAFCGQRAFLARSHPILKKAEPQVCRHDDLPRYDFRKKFQYIGVHSCPFVVRRTLSWMSFADNPSMGFRRVVSPPVCGPTTTPESCRWRQEQRTAIR